MSQLSPVPRTWFTSQRYGGHIPAACPNPRQACGDKQPRSGMCQLHASWGRSPSPDLHLPRLLPLSQHRSPGAASILARAARTASSGTRTLGTDGRRLFTVLCRPSGGLTRSSHIGSVLTGWLKGPAGRPRTEQKALGPAHGAPHSFLPRGKLLLAGAFRKVSSRTKGGPRGSLGRRGGHSGAC